MSTTTPLVPNPVLYPLWLLVGPSGSGKTTAVNELMKLGFQQLTSTSTREPRQGESEGDPYYFISRNEFETRVTAGDFIQTVDFSGNLYGTTREEALTKLGRGPAIAIVEGQGPANFKKALTSAVYTAFLDPGSKGILVDRMRARGDSFEAIGQRLWADTSIWEFKDKADFVIESVTIAETVACLQALMIGQSQGKAA